ncbi:GNAT family N-acetyltransferase [Clostridium sp. MCC353]|uniref:GNAT family N-acetyltransferase n=1 Tax=Clostridium sp. MCC353 TaxID=2592646 RepID=UPI001C02D2F1|nr:GNAT family N-acetyltransferase [Clostridium sp. MCC353]MBT9776375.1 GNAT family N-acetyltransferase [Clostridium sp. MCC353]
MPTPELETERLILRNVHADDVDDIFNCWMQDEDVSRYMFWKASEDLEDAREFVDFELGNIENSKWYRWIILLKNTWEVIGTCLIYFNEEEDNWDISYNLGKKFWGRGYASEAMGRVMQYAREILNIRECIAVHAIENPASGNVIQKLGFSYEKDVPYECNGGEIVTTGRYYRFTVK